MLSVGLPPWIPPSIAPRVNAYRRELLNLWMGALHRPLRDMRSDRLVLRHIRTDTPLLVEQVDRLVGFYARALGQWSDDVEEKLLRKRLALARFRSEWSQYLNQEPVEMRARTIKVWRTREDPKVREAHEMEGRAVLFDGLFATQDGGMQWAPPYAYNCRCWITVHVLDAPPGFTRAGELIVPDELIAA